MLRTSWGEHMGRSVKWYTPGMLRWEIHFPEGQVQCQWCPLCRSRESLKRHECILTGEYLVYPFDGIGGSCPLEFKEDQNGGETSPPAEGRGN